MGDKTANSSVICLSKIWSAERQVNGAGRRGPILKLLGGDCVIVVVALSALEDGDGDDAGFGATDVSGVHSGIESMLGWRPLTST